MYTACVAQSLPQFLCDVGGKGSQDNNKGLDI